MLIESVDNTKIKYIKKLKEKKHRREEKLFLIEGSHGVEEAYKSNMLKEVILLEDNEIDVDIAKTYVSKKVMKEITSLTSIPAVIGVCYIKEEKELGNKVILLDNVQDPGNIGTIIRSAVAFGIDTIVLENSCDPYNSKVVSATQGLIFNINIVEDILMDTIHELKLNNIKIYGTDVDEGINLKELSSEDKYALIVGNEGQGVRNELLKACDIKINIKTKKDVESLNVAVASSIIMYQLGE